MADIQVGLAIKTTRESKGLTQRQVADSMGCARTYVIKIELCDKALEAERLLREMTADRDLWQQAHDEDCPNKALVETLEAEIARLKGDRDER